MCVCVCSPLCTAPSPWIPNLLYRPTPSSIFSGGHVYDRRRQERSATPTSTDANNTITALLANATTVWCQNQKAPGSDSMHGLVPQPGLVQGANASSQSAGGAPGSTPLAYYNTGRFPTTIPGILPSVRRIALNNSQMHDVFQHKGGNYLHDYMATTKQEAERNFPNLLLMTAPVKVKIVMPVSTNSTEQNWPRSILWSV